MWPMSGATLARPQHSKPDIKKQHQKWICSFQFKVFDVTQEEVIQKPKIPDITTLCDALFSKCFTIVCKYCKFYEVLSTYAHDKKMSFKQKCL